MTPELPTLLKYLRVIEKEVSCVICLSLLDDPFSLPCNHQFCKECIEHALKEKSVCPLCKLPTFKRAMRKNPTMANIVDSFKQIYDLFQLDSSNIQNGVSSNLFITPPSKLPKSPIKSSPSAPQSSRSNDNETKDESNGNSQPKRERALSQSLEFPPKQNSKKSNPLRSSLPNKTLNVAKPNGVPKKRKDLSESLTGRKKSRFWTFERVKEEEEDNYSNLRIPRRSRKGKKASSNSQEPPQCKRVVLLGTSLTEAEYNEVQQVAQTLGGEYVTSHLPSVTHVITFPVDENTARRTIKYCYGVLNGAWVVSIQWVRDSLKANKWISEELYEVSGDTVGMGSPHKGRLCKQRNESPLFGNLPVFLFGVFNRPYPPRSEVEGLLTLGGAQLLDSIPTVSNINELETKPLILSTPDCESTSECEMWKEKLGLSIVDVQWLFDSISKYELQPTEDYALSFEK